MSKKILLILLVLLFLGSASFIVYDKVFKNNPVNDKANPNENEINNNNGNEKDDEKEVIAPKPEVKIINLKSTSRPIAVMIDNHSGALPQVGLQDAYIIYEIVVEGGLSRFLALFLDKNTAMIGPVRSARHYFLDYALENNAIYAHFGYSPQALNDIKTYGVNNISGTQSDGSAFWREGPLASPHNVYTSIAKINERAANKGYSLISDNTVPLLNYSTDDINLDANTGAIVAAKVRINYSSGHYVGYTYDNVNKVYLRTYHGSPQVDRITNQQYSFKNVIVISVTNRSLGDPTNLTRQGLDNVGTGTGYYITNGYAIPITWAKDSRTARTRYLDLNGIQINVNDGNTFINIQPSNQRTIFE